MLIREKTQQLYELNRKQKELERIISVIPPEVLEQRAVIEVFKTDEVTLSYSQAFQMHRLSEMGLLRQGTV